MNTNNSKFDSSTYAWWAGIALCLLGGLALLSTWRVLGAFFAAIGIALLFYVYRLESLTKQSHVRNVTEYLQQTLAGDNQRASEVRRLLSRHRYDDNLEKPIEAALDQLTRLENAHARFEKLLRQKLNPGELTYQRFHDAANALVQQALGMLEELAALLVEPGTPDGAVQVPAQWTEKAIARLSELNQAIAKMQRDEIAAKLGNSLNEIESLKAQTSKYFTSRNRHG